MSYFILEEHKSYHPPRIRNWYGKIETNPLKRKGKYLTKKYTTYPIESHLQTAFFDILLHPCLMVSQKAKEIIDMYDPTLKYEQLLLYDPQNRKTQAYYLPKLPHLDVLTENTQFNFDKSEIIHAEISRQKTHQKALFQVAKLDFDCILIHLDLIESLLRQDVICMGLKETTII